MVVCDDVARCDGIWWKWEMVGGPWWLSTRLQERRLDPNHSPELQSVPAMPDRFLTIPDSEPVGGNTTPAIKKTGSRKGSHQSRAQNRILWSKKQQERLKSAACKDSLTSTTHASLTSAPRVTIQFSHSVTHLPRDEGANVQPCMLALGASPNASSNSYY